MDFRPNEPRETPNGRFSGNSTSYGDLLARLDCLMLVGGIGEFVMRMRAIVALAFHLAGCATITRGTSQVVAVSTPGVPGATCTLTSPSVGTQVVVTPATISLP